MLGALAIAAALTAGFTACTNDNNIIADEPATEQPAAVTAYQVSIPASFGGDAQTRAVEFDADGSTITTTFKTTDKIYVYNQTQQAWASNGTSAYMTLAPAADGQQTELTGALKFYYMTSGTITATPITPAVGDVLHLYYNPNNAVFTEPKDVGFYYYLNQTGSAASASAYDFAEATMKIKSIDGNATDGYTMTLCQVSDETKGTAEFQNLGSMYRQRLTFKNASDETVTPTITGLKISSKNSKLVRLHWPLGEFMGTTIDQYNHISIENPVIDANRDIYFALRFRDSDGTDALTLTATDSEGNVYECTKAAPTGGFQNGKYYHGAMTLNWTKQLVMPTITGATSMNEPNANGFVGINDNPAIITFSGTSIGYYFRLWKYGTVTLDNLNATYEGNGTAFLSQNNSGNDNEIVLTGANSITCIGTTSSSGLSGLWYNGNLKLRCTGTSATLTITCKDARYSGILAQNFPTNTADYSVLAATGYTISRTGGSNGDGTYTWTYTVAASE